MTENTTDKTSFWSEPAVPPEELAIRANLPPAEVRKRITVSEWLERARDLYAFFTNTGRRPRLLSQQDVEMLEDLRNVGEWDPHHFLRAVLLLAGDSDVDHLTLDIVPWRDWSREKLERAPGAPLDWLDYCTAVHIDERRKHAASQPDPNCRARNHLARFYPVYDFAMAVSHVRNSEAKGQRVEGTCWLSEHTTEKFTGLTRKTVRKHIAYLVEAGWLIVLKKPRRGVNGAGQYRVVEHDEWVGKNGTGDCAKAAKVLNGALGNG